MSEQFPEYTEEVGSCKACGNSPVNHLATQIVSTTDVYAGTISKYLRDRGWVGERRLVRSPGQRVERVCFALLHALRITRYAHDIERAKSYRSRVIWQEAIRRGIPMEQVMIFGMASELYRAKINGDWAYFESLPVPPKYEEGSVEWVGDKFLLKRALEKCLIPVPRYASVRSVAQARKAFKKIGGSVIVKPRIGTRGRHTTIGVCTEGDLEKAVKSALKLCGFVSIEEELKGSVCRGTVIGNKLVGFFQADPPIVVGDGYSTLQELITKANASREERVAEILPADETLAYLERRGYELDKIPAQGEEIRIGHRTGRLFGGKTREILDTVHPKLRKYLEDATKCLDTPLTGFDLIIQDPEKDPDTQRWGIIEANTLPFIDLHYLPLHGIPSNPAAAVWDLWKDQK
jgi:cyanophycin synthetase